MNQWWQDLVDNWNGWAFLLEVLVDDQAGHRRIVPLSLGLIDTETPIGEPYAVHWDAQLQSLMAKDLTLEAGDWPAELA